MRWILLALVSIFLSAFLQWLKMPAALMFGPMLAAIGAALLAEARGQSMHVPKIGHAFAQAMIGCLIARSVSPDILQGFVLHWPLYLMTVGSTVVAACVIGWLLSRLKLFPGTVAIWGLLPGAASAMMILAEEYGADSRLVAFMQYLRVVCVGVTASLCARFLFGGIAASPTTQFSSSLFPDFFKTDLNALPVTVLLVFASIMLAPRIKLPASILLLPMVAGGILHFNGLIKVELPQWLLAAAYCLLGWTIGMRFTREAILHAIRLLPRTLGAIFALIIFCAGLAFILHKSLGIDHLTAYLATSPGGMDTIAIIAASSKVDMPFIMALQTVRFLMVLAAGPPLSRLAANSLAKSRLAVGVHDEQLLLQIAEDEGELD